MYISENRPTYTTTSEANSYYQMSLLFVWVGSDASANVHRSEVDLKVERLHVIDPVHPILPAPASQAFLFGITVSGPQGVRIIFLEWMHR